MRLYETGATKPELGGESSYAVGATKTAAALMVPARAYGLTFIRFCQIWAWCSHTGRGVHTLGVHTAEEVFTHTVDTLYRTFIKYTAL